MFSNPSPDNFLSEQFGGKTMSIAAWLPTILSVVGVVVTTVTPQIQTFLSTHPVLSTVAAGLFAIFSHFAPSPLTPPKSEEK